MPSSPPDGRDSIFVRLMPRSANSCRTLTSVPGPVVRDGEGDRRLVVAGARLRLAADSDEAGLVHVAESSMLRSRISAP